jgi:TetR/AcrR family transcriptional regulator
MEELKDNDQISSEPANNATTPEKIRRAALAEFAELGLRGARIDRIAERAGVNKAMIYYHFKSKDDLYIDVVRSFYRQIGERARESVMQADTLEQALSALARLHADEITENRQIVPLILREMAAPKPEVINVMIEAFTAAGLPKRIMTILQNEMGTGAIRRLDIKQVMVAFISMSLGYMAIAPMVNRILDIEDQRQFTKDRPPVIVDIFLNGLRTEH